MLDGNTIYSHKVTKITLFNEKNSLYTHSLFSPEEKEIFSLNDIFVSGCIGTTHTLQDIQLSLTSDTQVKGDVVYQNNQYRYKFLIPSIVFEKQPFLTIEAIFSEDKVFKLVEIETQKASANAQDEMKILIASTGKTGNTWLRQLLSHVYDLPIVKLSRNVAELKEGFSTLGHRWVAHQHYENPGELVDFLNANKVTLLTIKRHPADVLISLFNFIQWLPKERLQQDAKDKVINMRHDQEVMGEYTFDYVKHHFFKELYIPLHWEPYTVQMVSYEELLQNPLKYLEILTNQISTCNKGKILQAVAACDLKSLRVSRVTDPKHFRKGVQGEWKKVIPNKILELFRTEAPYPELFKKLDYSMDKSLPSPPSFDYASINPFYKKNNFDNGVKVTQFISLLYFSTPSALQRWPDPFETKSNTCFFNWLMSPIDFKEDQERLPIITPVSYFIYKNRLNLQQAFPEFLTQDRTSFCKWFVNQAPKEYEIDPVFISVVDSSFQMPSDTPKLSKHHLAKKDAVSSFCDFVEGGTRPEWPIELFLEISNVCDLKCTMCTTFSALSPERFLKLKDSQRGFLEVEDYSALNTLLEHVLIVHCFGYGEPTIHPRFKEILTHILDYEVLVDFFTNGMHLTKDLCQLMVERHLFKVVISFSGATKKDYENVYLGGHFETVLEGIARLNEVKKQHNSQYPIIEINSIAFQHQVDSLFEFIDLMANVGVNGIELKSLVTYSDTPQLHGHPALMRPEIEGVLLEKAKEYAHKKGIQFNPAPFIDSADFNKPETTKNVIPIAEFKSIADTIVPLKPIKNSKEDGLDSALNKKPTELVEFFDIKSTEPDAEVYCFEPFSTFYLRKDGHVVPCCFSNNALGSFFNTSLGNINDDLAEDIWRGNGYKVVQDNVLQQRYPMNICKECIKYNQYPKHHAIQHKVGGYATWFEHVHKKEFDKALQQRTRQLGDISNKKSFKTRQIENTQNTSENKLLYLKNKLSAVNSFLDFLETTDIAPQWPLEVFLEISNVCDLKCAMCATFSGINSNRFEKLKTMERGFLEIEDFTSLDSILQHSILVHCFGYGEATIHPRFKEIIDYISNYEVLIHFFTNGMHFTEELCQFLVDKKVFKIVISFSGSNKKDYENVYLGGNFETVLDGIARLDKIKQQHNSKFPIIEINSLSFQHHVDTLYEFIDLMKSVGANIIGLKSLLDYTNNPEFHAHAAKIQSDTKNTMEIIQKYSDKQGIHFNFNSLFDERNQNTSTTIQTLPLHEIKATAKKIKPKIPPKDHQSKPIMMKTALEHTDETIKEFLGIKTIQPAFDTPCFEAFHTFYLRTDGQTIPCCFPANYVTPSLGDTRKNSGEEIWRGNGYQSIRQGILVDEYPVKVCKECVKFKHYPKHHAAQHKIYAYADWIKQVYGQDFPQNIQDRANQLGQLSNRDIINRKILLQSGAMINSSPLKGGIFSLPSMIQKPHAWIEHIPFAFYLIETLKPSIFVALGVHMGNSYNAFCQAVQTLQLNTQCYGIDTWQDNEHINFHGQSIYQELSAYQEAHYSGFSYLLKASFDEMLDSFENQSIDLLHIDGLHTYDAVKHDFESWLPKMSHRGIIIFHGTTPREHGLGIWRLWEEISIQYPSFNFEHGDGLGILAVGNSNLEEFLSFIKEANLNSIYQLLFSNLGHLLKLEEENKALNANLEKIMPNYFTQLFVDEGHGFSEDRCIIYPIQNNEHYFEFELSHCSNIVGLRFDPVNAESIVLFNQITGIDNNGIPHQLSCKIENAEQIAPNMFEFNHSDPQILINIDTIKLSKVIISITYMRIGSGIHT